MAETGQFATLWKNMATKLGLQPEFIPGDWRHGADPGAHRSAAGEDASHAIKAVCVVHNETSTGVTSRIAEVRKAIDRAAHPALLMVDTISSLASIDYRHDEWGVDVTVGGSQKGLMLPPGLSFNAVGDKALAAAKTVEAAEILLVLGRNDRRQQDRLLPVYARHQPALRTARGAADAARGRRPGERVPPPRAPRRSHAPCGARLGPGNPVR